MPQTPHPHPAPPPFLHIQASLAGLVASAGWIATAATLAGFAGAQSWFLDLFAHFRAQYLAGLALAALLLCRRHPRQALVFLAAALLNAATLWPLYFPRATPTPATPTLRIMLMNVNTRAGDPPRVARAITDFAPDLLVLEEVSERWLAALASTLQAYPYGCSEPRDDNFGIALYSRLPCTETKIMFVGDVAVPSAMAIVETADGPLTVFATHPLPPAGRAYAAGRDNQLAQISAALRKLPHPQLLIGDLNVSPWSAHFRQLVRDTALRDSARGRGLHPTWPAGLPWLWIPLDHALHSDDIQVVTRTVGPNVGSDHYPLILDLRLTSPSKP